jgi:Phage integrase family
MSSCGVVFRRCGCRIRRRVGGWSRRVRGLASGARQLVFPLLGADTAGPSRAGAPGRLSDSSRRGGCPRRATSRLSGGGHDRDLDRGAVATLLAVDPHSDPPDHTAGLHRARRPPPDPVPGSHQAGGLERPGSRGDVHRTGHHTKPDRPPANPGHLAPHQGHPAGGVERRDPRQPPGRQPGALGRTADPAPASGSGLDRHTGPGLEHGERSSVAVWTARHLATFLDEVSDDRPYALWWLIALRGLRRGEAAGLRWVDVDLDQRTVTIAQQRIASGNRVTVGPPKTAASRRTIALDQHTVRVLQRHQRSQLAERATPAGARHHSGYVFATPNGEPLHPDYLTRRFRHLVKKSGLPPVRLHDLLHGAATLTHSAGADLKTVQEQLGHTSIVLTADTYTSVLLDLHFSTAEATARLVLAAASAVRQKTRPRRRPCHPDLPPPRHANAPGQNPYGPRDPAVDGAATTDAPKDTRATPKIQLRIGEQLYSQVTRGGAPGDRTQNPRIKKACRQVPFP